MQMPRLGYGVQNYHFVQNHTWLAASSEQYKHKSTNEIHAARKTKAIERQSLR
jgi:hypothetical protein